MSKSDFAGMFNDLDTPAPAIAERNEGTGSPKPAGRPRGKGKRHNPAYRQYTVWLNHERHDEALRKLQQTTLKPVFEDFVDQLIADWLKGQ